MPLKFTIEKAKPKAELRRDASAPPVTRTNELPGFLRFSIGIASPVFLAAGGIWFGLIRQRINLPTHAGNISRSNYFTGDAAIWAGVGVISIAFSLFLLLFVCRRPFHLNPPFFLGMSALLAGIACAFVASAMN